MTHHIDTALSAVTMPHRLDILSYTHSILAFAGAFLCWIADAAASGLDFIPIWIKELGLPVAFCALMALALVSVFRVNQALHNEVKETTQESGKVFLATTRELIEATKDQTSQLEKLTDQLKNRPCQMPPTIFPRRVE